jgi:DNA-binding transcriptional MerR regulator
MPIAKAVLNAFSAREVNMITGLSLPMIDYLSRIQYLEPSYDPRSRIRGKVRYYSYRDLVVARAVQRFREAGLQLNRLKSAVEQLRREETWFPQDDEGSAKRLRWLVTDGRNVFLRNEDGFLDELRPNGQRAFAFVISLENVQREVMELIPEDKLEYFSMRNEPPISPKAPRDRETA